ncbi:MAG: response regulator [Planctomycetes bacterium]|nr:response regulator [Planctomycetota bacterium]
MENERVFLLPGEYHVSRTPCQIATLLGSCVAVCLFHKNKNFAAMNHYLLSRSPNGDGEKDKGRYGDTSIRTIIWLMKKLDETPGVLSARIYGGAKVVSHLSQQSDIGTNNINVARDILKQEGIPILEEDVGGTSGRRIYFDTGKKQTVVRTIEKSAEVERLAQKRADIAGRDTRVLIVDDSALVRKILRSAVDATPGMEVCGEAEDAFEARDLILATEPDVISLDIIMPKLDGLKFLKSLSQHYPKPVVICSTIAKDKSAVAERARKYGAVDVVDKDTLELYKGLDVVKHAYIPKLKFAAGKAVRKMVIKD